MTDARPIRPAGRPRSDAGHRPGDGRPWIARTPRSYRLMLGLLGLAAGAVISAAAVLPYAIPVTVPPSPPTPVAGPSPGASNPTSGTPGGSTSPSCYPYTSPTPSAILIPTGGPGMDVGLGGALGAQVEFGALTLARGAAGATVDVPSVFAYFPLRSGGTAQVYFAPHSFVIPAAGWVAGSTQNRSVVEPNGLALAHPGTAVLSSQKIAVLSDHGYGTITLEVRWRWSVTPSTGSARTGSWTVPTNSSLWPSSVPSEFYPAPYVTVLSTNGPTGTIGTDFTAKLGGIVAARYFFLELENPVTGKVAQDSGQTASSGATSTTVAILLLNYDRYLYPGQYLVHVHDTCGALLVSLSEKAVYASSATIAVTVQPSSCGKVTFNGTAYGSGSTVHTTPSSSPYSFQLPGCAGHTFKDWNFTGGLYPYSGTQLLVSSSGTFTAYYR